MKYKYCIFDLYGTLVDIHTDEEESFLWEKMTFFYNYYGAVYQPEELRREFLRVVREKEAGLNTSSQRTHEGHPEIRIESVFQELYRLKGVEADEALAIRVGEIFRQNSLEYIQLYEGVSPMLYKMKAAGHKLYILANAQHIFAYSELESLGILGYFDAIYLSSDCGCRKPDPKFFRKLLDEQGIDPKEAVMVGDDAVCDIEGAKTAGLTTIYVHSNLSPDKESPKADYVFEKMDLMAVQKILMMD